MKYSIRDLLNCMAQVKGGCVIFILGGIVGMVAAGYVAAKITQLFAPIDKTFPASVAIIVGIDVLALTVLAYVSHAHAAASKQHNTAIRVCGTFAVLGAMCGRGYGLPWLCAMSAVNVLLGLAAWWTLVRPITIRP